MNVGQHHLHVRKRATERLEPYPSREGLKALLDRVMPVAALVGPVAMLPQLFQIFETRDVSGLSLTMWLIWTVLTVLWIFYGIVHKEVPIVLAQSLYLVLHAVIIFSIIIFG